ncbi:sugar ABC transporter ATP-binding protein [Alloalcanivorax gelatiniphagus]
MGRAVTAEAVTPGLRVSGLSKRFGSTQALSQVDLELEPGEVHGLLGHNGSGKSTLIKVLAGYQASDEGVISFAGTQAANPVPTSVLRDRRVRFVHQSLGLVDRLSVAENLWIDEIAQGGTGSVSFGALCRDAKIALNRFGQDFDPRSPVSDLSAVQKANLAIVRAMSRRRDQSGNDVPSLLVLDEPTAFLPQEDKSSLYNLVSVVSGRGSSVLFVSHFLDEVLALCHRVSVLRDGKVVVAGRSTNALTRDDLVRAIVGETLASSTPEKVPPSPEVQVVIDSVAAGSVKDFSVDLRRGEIVGVTGLIGSGSDLVCSAVFGSAQATAGSVRVGQRQLALVGTSPGRSLRAGISHVPADRNKRGVFATLSVTDNVSTPSLRLYRQVVGLSRHRMRADAGVIVTRYDVRPCDPSKAVQQLSGGNAQKVMMAKSLRTGPTLLLLEEPTQGVDVGARRQIEQLVLDAAEAGASILLSSADPDQLAELCHRVVVMAGGRVIQILEGAEVTKTRIAEAYLAGPAEPASDLAEVS